jgi:hypothetical protein
MDPFTTHVLAIQERIEAGERPAEVEGPLGTIRLVYIDEEDAEDGEAYAYFSFDLPSGVFAEIDEGTWGELQGFRIPLPDATSDPGTD